MTFKPMIAKADVDQPLMLPYITVVYIHVCILGHDIKARSFIRESWNRNWASFTTSLHINDDVTKWRLE